MVLQKLDPMTFTSLNPNGLVLLGCGGNLDDWVANAAEELKVVTNNPTFTPDTCWKGYKMETTGGRIDIVLSYTHNVICNFFDMIKYNEWIDASDRMIRVKDYMNVFHSHHHSAPIGITLH